MHIIHNFNETFNQNITFSSLVKEVTEYTDNLYEKLFLETIKKLDDDFFFSNSWKENYSCNGFVKRAIITPFGALTFKRRYYMNKDTSLHDNFYFVDSQLQIPTRKHLTNEALVLIFNLACEVNSSYASSHAIPGVIISKQTISNYQKNMTTIVDDVPVLDGHATEVFDQNEVIYIEADEAHCNLQNVVSVDDSSEEIKTSKLDRKKVNNKNIINKLVLVHNGHNEPDLPLKKKSLANKHYFGGIHMPNDTLTDNIVDYIQKSYDLSKVKYIFVSGDGARWIKSLSSNLDSYFKRNFSHVEIISVLDKFHMHKYLTSIFGGESSVINHFKKELPNLTPERFEAMANAYFAFRETRNIQDDVFNTKVDYILNNFKNIKNQIHPYYECPASMEGQISHVYAKRLTSRPYGFSEKVLQNLTQMLIFKANGNNITSKDVCEWSKKYLPFKPRKYVRHTKNYKHDYSCDADLPALNSNNTNLKEFLHQISHPKFHL